MDLLILKICITLAVVIFFVGCAAIALRKHYIWLLVGQTMAIKGLVFGAFSVMAYLRPNSELMVMLIFGGVFLLLLLSLVGFSLIMRSKRVESSV
jgi:hypothetical protein